MKKLLSLLLAALMLLGMLAACSSTPDTTTNTPTDSGTQTVEPADSTEPADEPTDSSDSHEPMTNTGEGYSEAENESGTFAGADQANESGEYSLGGLVLPLTEEPVTFEIFTYNMVSSYGIDDLNEVRAYAEAEERTGVHIKWYAESFMSAQEKFNLSLASTDYYDSYQTGNVFNSSSLWIGGYDKYIEDEVIIDLADRMEQYAPNYWALANANDVARRGTRTDSGAMPFLRTINVNLSLEPTWSGPVVRNDILKQTGIDYSTVNTLDEYHDMLTALKAYCDTPLLISYSGYDNNFLSAWNLNVSYFVKDGQVQWGPATAEFKDYLKTMNQWYEEGLISKDFTNRDSSTRNNMMYYGDVLVFEAGYSSFYEYPKLTTVEGYELAPLYMPVLEEDQIRHVNIGVVPGNFLGGGNSVITTACEQPELLLSWLDYWYSEEGFYLGNYGIEGESWDWHEGYDRPTYTDMVEENPEGKTNSEMRFTYACGPFHAKLYDWRVGYFRSYGPDSMNVPLQIWDGNFDNAWSMPEVAVTQEESEDYAPAYNDVNTYASEMCLKFITGVEDIDAMWDTYLKTLEDFGLGTMLEVQQAALERYYQK